MTAYYTEFCEQIADVTPEERAWLEHKLQHVHAARSRAFAYEFEEERGGVSNFSYYSTPGYSGEIMNEEWEELQDLLQAFLREFRPTSYLVINYARTCSRPMLGAFGGGMVFITKDRIEETDAWGWYDEQKAAFAAETGTQVTDASRERKQGGSSA